MVTTRFHVWIARGDQCASDDFEGETKEAAKERAAEVYKVPADRLAAHPTTECPSRGCNG